MGKFDSYFSPQNLKKTCMILYMSNFDSYFSPQNLKKTCMILYMSNFDSYFSPQNLNETCMILYMSNFDSCLSPQNLTKTCVILTRFCLILMLIPCKIHVGKSQLQAFLRPRKWPSDTVREILLFLQF